MSRPSPVPKDGWASLFNGKDLSGWKAYGEERWAVEDGTIVGESTAGKYAYLVTDKTYRDFDLRARKCARFYAAIKTAARSEADFESSLKPEASRCTI